jgi:hypothetical protein
MTMKTGTVGLRYCIAVALSIVASNVYAAVPPYAERVREMQAILNDRAVFQLTGSNEVDSITWQDNNHYRVQWLDSEYFSVREQIRRCSVVVELVDDPWGPNEPPGGRKFHVVIDGKPVTCGVKKP